MQSPQVMCCVGDCRKPLSLQAWVWLGEETTGILKYTRVWHGFTTQSGHSADLDQLWASTATSVCSESVLSLVLTFCLGSQGETSPHCRQVIWALTDSKINTQIALQDRLGNILQQASVSNCACTFGREGGRAPPCRVCWRLTPSASHFITQQNHAGAASRWCKWQ